MRTKEICVAAVPAIALSLAVGTAHGGGNVMFDIPSGYQHDIIWSSSAGLANGIDVRSDNMAFKRNGFASEGVVRAYDYNTNTNQKGKVWFDAAEGVSLTSMTLDISGFLDRDSTARLKVYLDGELFKDKTWSFTGMDSAMTRIWDFGREVSSVRLTLENLNGSPYTGLDNIAFTTVPAPGALALLGLAGLVGSRRRRG